MALRTFTRPDLSRYDGQNGAPAYIGYAGRVYDVSRSWHWRGGRHWVQHRAGQDLTGALAGSPHGAEFLERVPVVGVLVGEG